MKDNVLTFGRLTKTDRIMNLIIEICRTQSQCIDDKRFREVLGRPSKSQYHKYINELTKAAHGRPAVLKRSRSGENFEYSLNMEIWPKMTLVTSPEETVTTEDFKVAA
jgi:hypothetical protein